MSNPAEPQPELPGLPSRAVQVLTSPGRLFESLRGDPRWFGALALGGVLVAIGNAALPIEIFEDTIRAQMAQSGAEVPDDLGTITQIGKWGSVVGGFLFWFVIGVIGAAIYSLVFRFGLAYEGTFKQYLSVTAHTLLIGATGSLLLTPARIFAEDPQLMLTVGALLPILEDGLPARFLGYLDLFNLWGTALVGYAVSILDGKRGVAASVTVALAVSALIALVIAAVVG